MISYSGPLRSVSHAVRRVGNTAAVQTQQSAHKGESSSTDDCGDEARRRQHGRRGGQWSNRASGWVLDHPGLITASAATLAGGHQLCRLLTEYNQLKQDDREQQPLARHKSGACLWHYVTPPVASCQPADEDGHILLQPHRPLQVPVACQTDQSSSSSSMSDSLSELDSALGRSEARLYQSLAVELLRSAMYTEAYNMLNRAVALCHNEPDVLYNLACCHAKALGTPTDWQQAISLWERASELGHGQASYQLGCVHAQGLAHCARDTAEAYRYMKLAADATVPQAQLYVGAYHLQAGEKAEAGRWFDKVERSGHRKSQSTLRALKNQNRAKRPPSEAHADPWNVVNERCWSTTVTPPNSVCSSDSGTECAPPWQQRTMHKSATIADMRAFMC